jgi:hypothetical protein
MLLADKLQQRFAPTQLVGAAIQATMLVLPVAKGAFFLLEAAHFDALGRTLGSVLLATGVCWLLLFFQYLPGATPISIQQPPRWPKITRTLADPTLSIGSKIRATLTNWFSLFLIVATLCWIAGALFGHTPLLP